MKIKKEPIFLILIIFLGGIIRFFRIEDLAVFLSDQASDSTKVLEILRGRLTLLGPPTSVGGFFNGPIVYYLMAPFYFIFKGEPEAGTVFQTVFQLLTLPFLFLLGKKLGNFLVGLTACFLFAVSPLMIDYSRAAFNAHPAIFFSTLILWLFFSLKEKFSLIKGVFLGAMLGFIFQMHYLTLALFLFILISPFFIDKKLFHLKYYLTIIVGFLIGYSPFLIFELRHQFLNTKLFFKYLSSTKNSSWSPFYIIIIWPSLLSELLFGNYLMGFFLFFLILFNFLVFKEKRELKNFFLFFLCIIFVGLIYGQKLQYHYLIAFHTSLILLFSFVVVNLFKKKKSLILGFLFLIFIFNFQRWHLGEFSHPLQQGLRISDFRKAAIIIKNDRKPKYYNVTMHAQGDNRAMPLRYFLFLFEDEPLGFENYAGAQVLYFLLPKSERVESQKMWEYTSFGRSKIVNKWKINEHYFLYKLEKR